MAVKRPAAKDKRRYVRAIDELGRVVVPVEFRRRFGLRDGSPVEMYVEGERVLLLPYEESCTFCGAPATFGQFRGRPLCRACAQSLIQLSTSEEAEADEAPAADEAQPPVGSRRRGRREAKAGS
jgi:transcriptional pleiotropic regulator of transition state genes